jgi:hypothetical protein
MSGGSSAGLERSWFGLWVGLPFILQLAVVEGVFFRWSSAVLPWAEGFHWPSIAELAALKGDAVAEPMRAAVLAGVASGFVGAVYLVLLFLLGMRRGDRFRGDLTTVLLALIFPAAALAMIFLVPGVYTKPPGSRIMMFRPDAVGLGVLAVFVFTISFFTAMAVMGMLGIVRGHPREAQSR